MPNRINRKILMYEKVSSRSLCASCRDRRRPRRPSNHRSPSSTSSVERSAEIVEELRGRAREGRRRKLPPGVANDDDCDGGWWLCRSEAGDGGVGRHGVCWAARD